MHHSSTRQTMIKISSRLFITYPREENAVNWSDKFDWIYHLLLDQADHQRNVEDPRREKSPFNDRHWWRVQTSCRFLSIDLCNCLLSRTFHRPSEARIIRSFFSMAIRSTEQSRRISLRKMRRMNHKSNEHFYFSWRKHGKLNELSRANNCFGP